MNLGIDDSLMEEARRVGGHSTKKEAVTTALREYVARHKQLAILDLFGTIEFDPARDVRRSRNLDRIAMLSDGGDPSVLPVKH
jgi:Arc/MetJ family transcription regulator